MPEIFMSTYTHGFRFELKEPVTKDGMVKICRSLEERFGEGNVFEPEAIGDGFIKWVDWPGKYGERPYKCMRQFGDGSIGCKWPWVPSDVMTTWVGNDEIALEPGKFVTFLKAFRTAPGWTDAELHIFKECLEEGGFKVKRIPSLVDKKRKRQND